MLDAVLTWGSIIVSLRRKVLQDHTFSDGFSVRKGDIVCAPLRAMGMDALSFDKPEVFDPERFSNIGKSYSSNAATTKYTDSTLDYPFWGLGKEVW